MLFRWLSMLLHLLGSLGGLRSLDPGGPGTFEDVR
jgi:hypothetical protein